MFYNLYNYWKKPMMYLNTNDETLKKHIQSINKVYIKTCENLNLQPEKNEITLDLVFKPNLKLIHKFFESFATDNKHKKTPGRKKQKVYQIINAGHASHLLLCNKQ